MGSSKLVTDEIFYGIPLFTSAAALLAFVLAFYALAARESKTPYIVASIFPPVLNVLATVFFGFSAMVATNWLPPVVPYLAGAAVVLLVISLVQIIYRILRIHNRQAHFRDDNLITNSWMVQNVKILIRRISRKPSYTHDPVGFPTDLKEELAAIEVLKEKIGDTLKRVAAVWEDQHSISLTIQSNSHQDLDTHLVQLATAFLSTGNLVQYTTATRHPIEFVRKLKANWKQNVADQDWNTVAPHCVIVDAYTPHFGFTDSTHRKWSGELQRVEGVHLITSAPTFAGVHTAAAKAFKLIKRIKKDKPRLPSLVIYEGMYALSDLESVEQYRIFIRHVIPSERLWGGMFTVIAETTIPPCEMALARSYSDLDLLSPRKDLTTNVVGET